MPTLFDEQIAELTAQLCEVIGALPDDERIAALNTVRLSLHRISPLIDEPVDCVLWIPVDEVIGNDYNPNAVAPPEIRLLEHSIAEDGYTQPIVGWQNGEGIEIVDGFHRNRIGKESKKVKARIKGYLPITIVNQERADRSDRIAATIRHNRARGKHQVTAMSEIVQELVRRNWSNERISKELGMDADEVLRLKQISGLAELFADRAFSEAWE